MAGEKHIAVSGCQQDRLGDVVKLIVRSTNGQKTGSAPIGLNHPCRSKNVRAATGATHHRLTVARSANSKRQASKRVLSTGDGTVVAMKSFRIERTTLFGLPIG